MVKMVLEILALVSVGWVSGAEIGSWFGIQPIVSRLPFEQQLNLEKSMLQSFGKIMPVLMPFSALVVILLAILSAADASHIFSLHVVAAVCIAITIGTTLIINVPINKRTAKWGLDDNFEKWSMMRKRWHFFQGVRGILFLVSFILLAIAASIH
ncbi:MAG TPA: DUF1772 domain-containing protein [Chryseolinea sp.]|nr:DUF1772 domain-containing protein [Chryseolinea sp.]